MSSDFVKTLRRRVLRTVSKASRGDNFSHNRLDSLKPFDRLRTSLRDVLSEMLVDSTKSILLILFGHLDEITDSFLELFRTISRPFDESDPDALVGI